jgi:hypothetical protein
MSLKFIWYTLTAAAIVVLIFYAGFLYGNREKVDKSADTINIVAPNLAKNNPLSQIQIKDILGSENSKDIRSFGKLYYIVEKENTNLLFRIEDAPVRVGQLQNKAQLSIPKQLSISLARKTSSGLDYEFKEIGVINFDEPFKDRQKGTFSTFTTENLLSWERIVFRSTDANIKNLYLDTDPDLPANVRNQPAPFFWIKL